jgi:hypothetical protein
VDQHGYVRDDQEDVIKHLSRKEGWKYVAVQKFPTGIQHAIFSGHAAAKVGVYRNPHTGYIVENDGFICHPKLADFVLSRMAREAAFVEGIPSITFGGLNHLNHLLDENRTSVPPEAVLLQYSLDLFVPDNLELLSTSDFLKIRQEYEGIRRSFWSYLRDVSGDHNLTLQQSSTAFLENLTRAREAIHKEFIAAEKAVGDHRFASRTACPSSGFLGPIAT